MRRITRVLLGTTAAAAMIFCVSCGGSSRTGKLEPYSDEARGFALFKPHSWEVATETHPNGYTVTVAPRGGGTRASLSFLTAQDRRSDSVLFAARTLQNIRAQTPSLEVKWTRSTPDRRKTVAEVEYRNAKRTRIRGRYYFMMNYPEARFFACEAPAPQFERSMPLLLSIVANVSFLTASTAGRQDAASRQVALGPVPQPSSLVASRLADGSATLRVPQGWNLIGQKGKCLCTNPEETAGFAFSTGEFIGPSRIPYFDSSTVRGMIHSPYRQPADAMALLLQNLKNRNVRIVSRAANPQAAQEAAARLRCGADAEAAVMTFTTAKGVAAKGYFDILGFQPTPSGQWSILFFAIWAPEPQFDAYRPVLEAAAASVRIDDKWAADYIERGLANLRRMMGETSRIMADTARSVRESSMASFQERMRSGDYIDYKRTSVIRGEQEWVSQVEGGALYKSDHWGLSREGEREIEGAPYNYPNFEGRNPRYNETMTPVDVSREVYESVYGAR